MTHTVPQNMKAAVMHNTREIKIETLPVPDINHDEVLIKVMAVGICGSDLHYYTNGRIGNYVVENHLSWAMNVREKLLLSDRLSINSRWETASLLSRVSRVGAVRRARKGAITFVRMYSFWLHRR